MVDKKVTSLKDVLKKLDENQKVLVEIARWTRFQNISKLKETLMAELDTDEKKIAYENTDGIRPLNEVARISGVPRDTLYGWWKKWFNLGILENSGVRKGRLARFCSLDYVGIKTPQLVEKKKEEETGSIVESNLVAEENKK